MKQYPASAGLLSHVRWRLSVARLGAVAFRAALWLSALFAVLVLVSRLTGLIPDWFTLPSILVLPVLATLLGLIGFRRPVEADAARLVDQHAGTKDLFLTLTNLERTAGEYQVLVRADAEQRVPAISPAAVVPWPWERPLAKLTGVMLLLVSAVLVLPALDPFGRVAAARQMEQRQDDLEATQQETQVRRAQLAEQQVDTEHSEDVDQALEDLKTAFRKMVPEARNENASVLAARQKMLNEKWKFSAAQLKALLTQLPLQQRFGARGELQKQKMLNDLKQGSSQALEEELQQAMEDLQDIAAMDDPLRRSEAMQRLRKKLDDLREFAQEDANSRPLAEALERAMKQLETARAGDSREMTTEALQALQDSIRLAELEARKLAQTARDMQQLEAALQALNMARRVNQEGLLDGQMCENCQSMQDYMELYAELMGGREQGLGTGGEGIGEGGEVPEDDSLLSDFKDEKTKTAIQKGKLLLAIKTKGVTEDNEYDLQIEYLEAIDQIKQSVTEAIEQEQVPPGYHAGIQKYFDSLEDQSAAEDP